jgi:hypothetical protein
MVMTQTQGDFGEKVPRLRNCHVSPGADISEDRSPSQNLPGFIVAIDQYAEAATGNRDFFLNKPPGTRHGGIP